MLKLIKWLKSMRYPYKPLITINIDKNRLISNIKAFMSLTGGRSVAPVLKSNAYGHGLIEVAKIIEDKMIGDIDFASKIPFFVIDSYFEAVALRAKGIKTPLLIIGFTYNDNIINSNLKNVSFVITSLDSLIQLKEVDHPIYIHLKIDTGMNRQGLKFKDLEKAIYILKSNTNIKLQGVCSHFADAENPDQKFTLRQIENWDQTLKVINENFNPKYIHISNTAGHNFAQKINANVFRLGLGMYGVAEQKNIYTKPVLEMKTIVASVKNIDKGESVGYNCTFTATKPMKIATIPTGYYEALPRKLSNIGFVKINNHFAPIIGKISMNISTIDITDIPNVNIGTEVTVISNESTDKNSITNIAKLTDSITYETLIYLPQHLKRIVV